MTIFSLKSDSVYRDTSKLALSVSMCLKTILGDLKADINNEVL